MSEHEASHGESDNVVRESPDHGLSLADALQLWIEVTGVDPCTTNRFTLGDFDTLQLHRAIKEALDLDATEITGRLLFEYVVTEYMRDRHFTVKELLEKPEQVAEYLSKSRDLLGYLRSNEMQSMADDFSRAMRQAVSTYGVTNPKVFDVIDSRHSLALLRRDAYRTLNHLRVDQFLDGNPEPDCVQPVYGKFLYQWWNINSMLKAMTAMPSGVTVNLIRHPTDAYQSYFAFAIRNGGRLFVFTDKEKTAHPLAADLMRRPDRILAERAARNWFPYDLMGLAFDEESGEAYIKQSIERGLVPYQSKALPLKAMADLDAPQVIWLTMMLDLIVGKFWRQEYRAPALSYTGEMVQIETPLIAAAQTAQLPVVGYQPLALKPLSMEDVRTGDANTPATGRRTGQNNWLEARYGSQVSENIINLVGTPDTALALDLKSGDGAIVVRDRKAEERLFFSDRKALSERRLEIDTLDATSFGTREDIEHDRRFIARSNYAKQINALAVAEYEARRDEIRQWVSDRIKANTETLFEMMAKPEIKVSAEKLAHFENGAYTWRGETPEGYQRVFMKRRSIKGADAWAISDAFSNIGNVVFHGSGPRKNGAPTCFMTGAASAFMVHFYPETCEDLALLCGCTTEELPDVLQHWTMIQRNAGNHILDRIDPMEWQCNNPWQKLYFQTIYFVSVRAMKAIERGNKP